MDILTSTLLLSALYDAFRCFESFHLHIIFVTFRMPPAILERNDLFLFPRVCHWLFPAYQDATVWQATNIFAKTGKRVGTWIYCVTETTYTFTCSKEAQDSKSRTEKGSLFWPCNNLLEQLWKQIFTGRSIDLERNCLLLANSILQRKTAATVEFWLERASCCLWMSAFFITSSIGRIVAILL